MDLFFILSAILNFPYLTCQQKRLRQYTWREYYHDNMTEEEQRLNRLHTGSYFGLKGNHSSV